MLFRFYRQMVFRFVMSLSPVVKRARRHAERIVRSEKAVRPCPCWQPRYGAFRSVLLGTHRITHGQRAAFEHARRHAAMPAHRRIAARAHGFFHA